MGVIITVTVTLCLWIILWALKLSGFDGILIAIAAVLVVTAVRSVAPQLARRRDR